LGRHVASEILNESVRMGPSRGLVADGIRGQVAELTDLVSHARTRTPIYHVHCDPEGAWGEQQRERFWELFEEEFGFQNQAYASQIHVKNDREHEHREYNRTRADGTAIRLDNDFARREKIARIVEHEFERDLVKGGWNKAVIAALERERPEVAAAMREAGLDQGERPVAPLTPLERSQQERTEMPLADIRAAAWEAWKSADSGPAVEAALAAQGLRLAKGDKVVVVVDAAGATHPFARLIGAAAKAATGQRVAAGDVDARLAGLALASVDTVRLAIRENAETPGAKQTGEHSKMELAQTVCASEAPAQNATGEKEIIDIAARFKEAAAAVAKINASQSQTTMATPQNVETTAAPRPDVDPTTPGVDGAAGALPTAPSTAPSTASPSPGVPPHDLADADASPDPNPGPGLDTSAAPQDGVASEILVARRDPEHPQRHLERRREQPRPERLGGTDGGRDAGGRDGGQARTAAVATRPAQGGRGQSNESATRPGRSDRRRIDPCREQAGRARLAARRESAALAEAVAGRGGKLRALTEALRPSPRERALQIVVAEEQRLAADRGPWPDNNDSYTVMRQHEAHVRRLADRAADEHAAAVARVNILDRLAAFVGIATSRVKMADALVDEREALQRRIATASRDGLDIAHHRQDEQGAWQAAHDIDVDLVDLVRAAVEDGDDDVIGAVVDGRIVVVGHHLRSERHKREQQEAAERRREEAQVEAQRQRAAPRPTPQSLTPDQGYTGPRFR